MTPYQYSLNNPVKWIDNNGLLPGDPFLTRNDAAHDFGKNYNPFSIYLNLEISTTIYKYADDKGNTRYTYAIPIIAGKYISEPWVATINKPGYSVDAYPHTHGAYGNDKKDPDDFSPPDKALQKSSTWDINPDAPTMLISPGGLLKIFDPATKATSLISSDLPSDQGNQFMNFLQILDIRDIRPIPITIKGANYINYEVEDARSLLEEDKSDN